MSRISQTTLFPQTEPILPILKSFQASQSNLVRLGPRIGRGAEGEVYEVQERSDLVAKIYHEPPPPEKAEKLLALARLGNERLSNLSAWPTDVLRDEIDGKVVGFLMKRISQAEEVHALHSPKSRLQKFPEASWAFLIYVASNIARAVAAMHEHGFVIGDVNPKNILVTHKATVYLLDVDSFQISADDRTYRCEGGFPEYTPPELQGFAFREVDRRPEHDYFGLAVVIFQLLFMGRHPYSGRFLGAEEMSLERAIREFRFAYGPNAETRQMRQPPGTLSLEDIPSPLMELFSRAFLSTDRPQPREWITTLDELAKTLKRCSLHSGHLYFQELSECPWCEIETRARVRLFNFLLLGADAKRGHFRLFELWREIAEIETPSLALARRGDLLKPSAPSPEIASYAKNKIRRFYISLFLSIVSGLSLPNLVEFPEALILLVLAGAGVIAIAKLDQSLRGETLLLFDQQWGVAGDTVLEKLSLFKRDADFKARQLEERWEKEAGPQRFLDRLDALRNQRETYENLAQIRQFRISQLESESRKNQLEDFLDQFEIRDAEIKGIASAIKSSLLSHGIETAADVVEEVRQIPTIGQSRSIKLLEWRRDLERKFVFDPTIGVSPAARIELEKEVDLLRVRLEHELSGGAYYLRQVKNEIEESSQQIQPILNNAHQVLAQAEKDWEVASKRNSVALIIFILLLAFFIGWAISSGRESIPIDSVLETTKSEPVTGPPPGFARDPKVEAADRKTQQAMKLYYLGRFFSRENRFAEAVPKFQEAVDLDPMINAAHEELGYALYRLKRYEESVKASRAAIQLRSDFTPYYNLGLVYVATENWAEAIPAFQQAIYLRDPSSWKDEYTQAYYYLGISWLKSGTIEKPIQTLEADLQYDRATPTNRFELANLYLCVGKSKAAREQYRILKEIDPVLAYELTKLMKKHVIRLRA